MTTTTPQTSTIPALGAFYGVDIPDVPIPDEVELRGPADADHFRVQVGRSEDRWYTDPLGDCPIAPALPDHTEGDSPQGWAWPSISTVKKAAGEDWSKVALKRVAAALAERPDRFAAMDYEETYDALKSVDSRGLAKASERGTNVHLYFERGLRGLPIAADNPREPGAEYLPAVREFFAAYRPKLVAAEVVFVHRDLNGWGYGGTGDGLIELGAGPWAGRLVLVDWKGLSLDTPIPTPSGWTTMGDLREGEEVFGADGVPTLVTAKSEVHWKNCYRIRFDDGSTIVADGEHRWQVVVGPWSSRTTQVLTTAEIADLREQGVLVRIDNAQALDLPDADLPVDPYVLGVWLGDGSRNSGEISKPDQRVWDAITARGYQISDWYSGTDATRRSVYGLVSQLRAAGVLGVKHVPAAYLRASRAQRLALLQGLMDSDGSWNIKRNHAAFENTDERLARAVYELVVSLGWRASWFEGEAHGFEVTCRRYRISFRPTAAGAAFRARGEVGRDDVPPQNSCQRTIKVVEKVPTVPTQCITVAAEDELYLAGSQMVVTHNSRGADSDHKAYSPELGQVGGYGRAQYMIIEGAHGPERAALPDIAGGLIVSIRPDGFVPYPVDLDAGMAHFTAMHAWWVARRNERRAVSRRWPPVKTDILDVMALCTTRRELLALRDARPADWLPQVADRANQMWKTLPQG